MASRSMRRVAIAACLSVLIVGMPFLSGCQGPDKSSFQNELQSQYLSGGMTVYYVRGDRLYREGIAQFIEDNASLRVTATEFEDDASLRDRLSIELMSNAGPDALLLRDTDGLDAHKMMRSGALLDASDLLAKDRGFDPDAYIAPILRSGEVDGKRYLLPMSWKLDLLYHIPQNGSATVDISDAPTLRALCDAILAEREASLDAEDRLYLTVTMRGNLLPELLGASGLPVFDAERKSVVLDEEAFRGLADFARAYQGDADRYTPILMRMKSIEDVAARTAFLLEDFSAVNSVQYYRGMIEDAVGKELVTLPLPTWAEGGSYAAQITHYGGIRSGCADPGVALALLRYLMDAPTTCIYFKYDDTVAMDLPCGRSALDALVREASTNDGIGRTTIAPLPEDAAQTLTSAFDRVAVASLPDRKVMDILERNMAPYLSGASDFDACFAGLRKELERYLDE